jgi:hypothetical protein
MAGGFSAKKSGTKLLRFAKAFAVGDYLSTKRGFNRLSVQQSVSARFSDRSWRFNHRQGFSFEGRQPRVVG